MIGSVTKEKNRKYAGKNIAECAAEEHMDPCEWFGKLAAEEEGKVGIILFSVSEKDVERIIKLPYTAIISDSLYGGGDNPHPRLYGAFPKMIREYVQEKRLLSLEEAICKMTSMPAKRIGLSDRGVIDVGYAADINIFDPEKIRDKATFTDSRQLSEGIAYTLIGGQIAAKDSRLALSGRYGQLLRKKK